MRRVGSPFVITVAVDSDSADIASNDRLYFFSASNVPVVVELLVVGVGASEILTMRSGLGKGSGFRSAPSTTLNMAALAPMPSASTPIATNANPGSRRKRGQAVARVPDEVFDPANAAIVAMVLLHLIDAAEPAQGFRACLGGIEPACPSIVLGQLEMRANFVFELALQAVGAEQGHHAGEQPSHRHALASRMRATSAAACSQFVTST